MSKDEDSRQDPEPVEPIEAIDEPDDADEALKMLLDLDAQTPEEAGYGHGV